MSKKTLPKAIRTATTGKSGSESHLRMSEPLPERTQSTKARQGSSIRTGNVIDTETIPDERKARARKLVERFSLWSAIAGMLPVPVVDLAAVGAVQIQMLRRISQIYDVPFSKNRGKAIIASFAGTMIPVSAGLGVASTIKSVPVAGTAIGAMTTPALSVAATYVIGMAFIEHFSRGGTLLDFEPPDYREFIKTEMDLRKSNLKSHRYP
ncbi:MAG TPA: YcjF family protein [Pseudolabrys sp.]|nr:YcjF family protein [Pseudolabrys sp.]